MANLWREYEVGMGSNRRYLDALAAAAPQGEGAGALDVLCGPGPTTGDALSASTQSPDPTSRSCAVLAGEHAISGFRNTNITARLYRRPPKDRDEAHRRL